MTESRVAIKFAASPQSREVKGAVTVGEASDHGDPDEDTEEAGYSTHGSEEQKTQEK